MTDPNAPSQPTNPNQPPPGYGAPPPPPANPYGAPQGYGQQPPPPYGAQPGYGYGGPGQRTNTLAIISLIAAFVFSPAGIVCGHIALGQIKRTGEAGRPLALWGTILGYVFTGIGLLVIILSVILPFILLASVGGAYSDFSTFAP